MVVYLIKNETSGLTKIGHTGNIASRFSSLQTSSADRLRLIRLFEGGRIEERVLHSRYEEHWKSGEWFDLPPSVTDADLGLVDIPIPKAKNRRNAGIKKFMPGSAPSDAPSAVAQRQALFRKRRDEEIQVWKAALGKIVNASNLDDAKEIADSALSFA